MAIEDIASSLEAAASGLRNLEADFEAKLQTLRDDLQGTVSNATGTNPETFETTMVSSTVPSSVSSTVPQEESGDASVDDETDEPAAPSGAEATNVHASDVAKEGEGASVQVPVEEPTPATLATPVEAPAQEPQPAEATNVHASDGPLPSEQAAPSSAVEPEVAPAP